MLRIYLDSNVFRYIKPQHRSYNSKLHSLMNALVGEALFIYSVAHLDDLKNSVDPYREDDLKIMEKYVDTNFFWRDRRKNITQCLYVTPSNAFNQIDYNMVDQTLYNFDLDTLLFKDLDDTPLSNFIRTLLGIIFNTPIASFGQIPDTSTIEGVHKEWFDKMLPNYSPQMSLKDFMNAIMPYIGTLFNDSKEVTELRNYVESYMHSDTYSYKLWGMDFNEKLNEKFGKTFLEMIDAMITENQKDDLFLRFQHTYCLLEMLNITRETSSGKTKKFDYWSLHNDAAHRYFASLCDVLVTDDKGLQVKAQIMYSLFGIQTAILSTSDFVAMTDELLTAEKTSKEFFDRFVYNLKNPYFISAESVLATRETVTYYELPKPHFNVFPFLDRIDYPEGNSRFVLTLVKERNEIPLLNREVALVLKKVYRVLGQDLDDKGELDPEEIITNGLLRQWMIPNMYFQLAVEQEEDGTFFFKLYIDLDFRNEEQPPKDQEVVTQP